MRSRIILTISLLAIVAAACSQPSPPPAPQPDLLAEERAIRDADAQWLKAVQARDAAGDAAAFAADGVVYRAHYDPIVGQAAIAAFTEKELADNPESSVTWTTDSITVAKSADIAVQTGSYTVAGLGPKGDGSDAGRFVTVWKKVDGAWKVAYDIGSSTVPEPPAKK